MPIRPNLALRARLALALACALPAASADAQLHLPSMQLPPLPDRLQRLDALDSGQVRDAARRWLDRTDVGDLRAVRLDQIARLLQRHGDVLEADPRGQPVVRREILAWSPGADGLAAARAAGLTVAGERPMGDGESVLVLRVPDDADTAAALAQLRARDPQGAYDFNHIYTGSGAPAPGQPAAGGAPDQASRPAATARVGLIDSGIDRGHEVFRDAAIVSWGCDGVVHPSAHGTAVAALMVGRSSRFQGVAPRATLYAADIYCDSGAGGSAARIVAALDWLARQRVAVINLSLVGPPNQILERAVAGMVKRGHLLVAAVGNDGPAAPALYPASYPGVVGVSAVDRQDRPLPEAARGPQVMFAAPGNQMVSAAIGSPPYRMVRGTSFAAPIVATLLAGALDRPAPAAARQALERMAQRASGTTPGKVNNETGYGVLGTAFRNDPSGFR
ncbi:MAG TPA: S8 family serine peptidase [Burkholderiaceae bacterium]|nr:S8 family serine peptidase [Burkholderiaceae bacterium]